MDMRQVKHSKKPDTRRNPEGVEELVERQMAREKEGFFLVKHSTNTLRMILLSSHSSSVIKPSQAMRIASQR